MSDPESHNLASSTYKPLPPLPTFLSLSEQAKPATLVKKQRSKHEKQESKATKQRAKLEQKAASKARKRAKEMTKQIRDDGGGEKKLRSVWSRVFARFDVKKFMGITEGAEGESESPTVPFRVASRERVEARGWKLQLDGKIAKSGGDESEQLDLGRERGRWHPKAPNRMRV